MEESKPRNMSLPEMGAKIIRLVKRNNAMIKNSLISRNPLLVLINETGDMPSKGGFGAVTARAGIGKTALLVQLALNRMFEGKRVLHVSLADPVSKVNLWYEQVLRNMAEELEKKDQPGIWKMWENILPLRFIMTFTVDTFTVPRFRERLSDLTEQDIFQPEMVLIDGYSLEESSGDDLREVKNIAKSLGASVWFAVKGHRAEITGESGMPGALKELSDLFDIIIRLVPDKERVLLELLKGCGRTKAGLWGMYLDAQTMLVKGDGSEKGLLQETADGDESA